MLLARAEATAGIFPRFRLAGSQNSPPIVVVYPAARVVLAVSLTGSEFKTRATPRSARPLVDVRAKLAEVADVPSVEAVRFRAHQPGGRAW